jgi:hypothetical protein
MNVCVKTRNAVPQITGSIQRGALTGAPPTEPEGAAINRLTVVAFATLVPCHEVIHTVLLTTLAATEPVGHRIEPRRHSAAPHSVRDRMRARAIAG